MDHPSTRAVMTIDAEVRTGAATAQLVRFDMQGPNDDVLRGQDSYWLDLCLTPRPGNARGCFSERWTSRRFIHIGRILFVPPHEALHARSDGHSSQTSVLCHLQQDALQQWFGDKVQWTSRQLEAGLDVTDPHVRNLLLRMADELRRPGFASQALIELISAQLGIELRRYFTGVVDEERSGGLAPWRLRLIDERLRDTLAAPTLAELAGLCRLSIRQLTRGFRASRGCSIGDYVAQSRLEHARRLLADQQSVKAVAYSLGFATPSSFCFAFRRGTGLTPGEFRRQHAAGAVRTNPGTA
ncbi:MAG: helix-turn-helix transcriptional regulator [Nevskia sp.]|nr:helix-turn-helix transcriptional regulator [Nevskia sp.]